ncbi:ABC transporter substrate-binding protein [Halomicrobium sp. HM KBTZ05]|uniref:ABC transporter substrate-binding protein n=1 Tax=Halomicrobium sp. HM KBTZ05 TaxID=3242663 RepID=UPI00355618AE
MSGENCSKDKLTRRDCVKYGSTVVGGGLFAGCTGNQNSGEVGTGTTTADNNSASTETAEGTATSETDVPYTVTMEPVGEVTFEKIPTSWLSTDSDLTDIAFCLGQIDGWIPTPLRSFNYFEHLGIDLRSRYPNSDPYTWKEEEADYDGKEYVYEVNPDLLMFFPERRLKYNKAWKEGDLKEITENVAPIFGANIYRNSMNYDQPSIYEAFEKFAQVFKEEARYEAFVEVHDQMVQMVKSKLPPEEKRPTIAYLSDASDLNRGKIYPVSFEGELGQSKHFQDLEAVNAFENSEQTDYEGLLSVDPDVIIIQGALEYTGNLVSDENGESTFNHNQFLENYVQPMEDDPIGQKVTAIQEGQIGPGGVSRQGPLTNLYNTEILAQQVYPEQFGEFDPENPFDSAEEHRLFDRERVRDIITGDF